MRYLVDDRELVRFAAACLRSQGVAEADASATAGVLVAADLRGVEAHGCARLRRYVEGLRNGSIKAAPAMKLEGMAPAVAVLDADGGLGQVAAIAGMEAAIERAMSFGIGLVGVRNSNHFGIAGYYASMAPPHGMIGFATTNASPQVAPTFGSRPQLGTNPIAVAVPTGGVPFSLDMATSVVPRGRLERMAWDAGEVPAGWAIAPDGRPATDRAALIAGLKAREGHALLPLGGEGTRFSGHKGFGLGLLVDLLCGPLVGASWGRDVYGARGADLGHLLMAVRIDGFRSLGGFLADVTQQLDEVRSSPRADAEQPIRVAGDRQAAVEAERRRGGIPLPQQVWTDLRDVAHGCRVAMPDGRAVAAVQPASEAR
jgi:L-2-hydroxycarboxylate dehydrogenase (NAD+)